MTAASVRSGLRVGLTFDLAGERPLGASDPYDRDAEHDAPATIDAIACAVGQLGHEVVRIGDLRALSRRLAVGALDADVVFNVAEGSRGLAREAQVPVLLEAFGVAYSGSDPVALAVGLDKGLCKRLWAQAGLPTAPFAVLAVESDVAALAWERYPAFLKPLAEGSSMGVEAGSRVEDQAALVARARRLWRAYRQPVLLEPYLPGPEFTVAVLERRGVPSVLGMLQTGASGVVRLQRDKRSSLSGVVAPPFVPVEDRLREAELAALALRAYRVLGARDFARIDLRCDAVGAVQLLEINMLPGLVPGRSPFPLIAEAAGLAYPDVIAAMLDGALRRRAGTEETP